MTDDLGEILERLDRCERDNARALEQRLAASHRKIVHELRREWLTTVLKSIFAALIATAIATATMESGSSPADSRK